MTISFPKSSHHSGLRFMKRNPHPKKERHGDCGVRAICLAFDLPYQYVWNIATRMKRLNADGYFDYYGNYRKSMKSATWGLGRKELMDTLECLDIDAVYKETHMTDCEGEHYHYFANCNLPDRCIAHVPMHWVAVKDGAIWDTYDSRGTRPRKLKGYVCLRSDL